MKTCLRNILVLACAAALVAVMPAYAQDIKERSLKLSLTVAKEHPIGVGAQRFADLMASKSGNKIKVTVYANSVLGSDNQSVSAARGGSIDLALLGANGLVSVTKEFMLFDFPFLFNSEKEAHAFADGPVGKKLMSKLDEVGLVGLDIFDSGFRNLTNNRRAVSKIEDIQGLKLRVVQSPIYLDMFKALGANPVPMAFSELYTALEQRAVDGQENPIGLIEATKFYEVQKYLTLTRHTYSGWPMVMSKKLWDTMSDTERKMVKEAAREATLEQRKLSLENTTRALDALKAHMQVIELTPTEVQRMRQNVQPVVDKYSKDIGENFVKEAYDELARIRASK